MEKKNEGIENKIIHRDFNCTVDKMDRDSGNTNHVIPVMSCQKLIVDNGLKDLW